MDGGIVVVTWVPLLPEPIMALTERHVSDGMSVRASAAHMALAAAMPFVEPERAMRPVGHDTERNTTVPTLDGYDVGRVGVGAMLGAQKLDGDDHGLSGTWAWPSWVCPSSARRSQH